MEQQIRQTAYKIWISDLLNKKVEKEEGEWSPNYILINNKQVSRVNIVATVVMKYSSDDNNYSTLTIDDGSGDVQLKAWKEDISIFNDIDIGDPILVIAKIREYNSEIYLTPEIVKILDKQEWIEVRKRELIKLYGDRTSQEIKKTTREERIKEPQMKEIEVEEVVSNNKVHLSGRQRILNSIENLDSEHGADIMKVIESSEIDEEKANLIIQELLKEGEIFEIRSGRLKIIE